MGEKENLSFELVNETSGSLGTVAESRKELIDWIRTATFSQGDRIVVHGAEE